MDNSFVLLGIVPWLVMLMLPANVSAFVSTIPSLALKNAIAREITHKPDNEKFSFAEVDLNNDGNFETVVILHNGRDCSNRHCTGFIFKGNANNNKRYKLISRFSASRGGSIFVSKKSSYGYKNIIASTFFYAPKRTEYRAWEFNGNKYEFIDKEVRPPLGKSIFDSRSSFSLR